MNYLVSTEIYTKIWRNCFIYKNIFKMIISLWNAFVNDNYKNELFSMNRNIYKNMKVLFYI